jgi:hypothetical protein
MDEHLQPTYQSTSSWVTMMRARRKSGQKVWANRSPPPVFANRRPVCARTRQRDLKGLAKLEYLDLFGTNVTDLSHLTGLTGLRELNLTGTNLTEAGVKQLQQSLTKTKIIYKPR